MLAHLISQQNDFATALFQFANATGQFCVGNIQCAVNMPSLKLNLELTLVMVLDGLSIH